MNSYELSRVFCDWCFENPQKVKPIHYAIYYFAIEHCNRLGWKTNFGLPSQMVMEAIGVKNWRTYSQGLNELVDFGFIKMIETSKNQYSSNIIAIVKNTKATTKAPTKALDKALSKHGTKQSQSTVSIDKQLNNLTIKQLNNEHGEPEISKPKKEIPSLDEFLLYLKTDLKEFNFEAFKFSVTAKYESWIDNDWKDGNQNQIKNWKTKLKNTMPYLKPFNQNQNGTKPNSSDATVEALRRFVED